MSTTKKNNKRGITRRDFIKWSAAAGAAAKTLDWSVVPAGAHTMTTAHTETTTICPYCSVSCGLTVAKDAGNNIIDIYGDADHVISRGSLCCKGAALIQMVNSPERLGAGKRPPGASGDGPWRRDGNSATWVDVTWDAALTDIASQMVSYRNADTANWDPTNGKYNSQAIAFFGCGHATNEENYVYRKFIANIGTNSIEHQARI